MQLVFPSDRIVGILDWVKPWDPARGPTLATGTISVPDDADLTLKVSAVAGSERQGESWAVRHDNAHPQVNLQFLLDLPADAIRNLKLGQVQPATISSLRHLEPGLDHLYLGWSDLGDDVLPHVAAMTNLIWLSTFGNHFTDQGVQQLVALQQLRSLYLEEETLTIEAFNFVSDLPHLERLGLQDVSLTDSDLAALKLRLPNVDVG